MVSILVLQLSDHLICQSIEHFEPQLCHRGALSLQWFLGGPLIGASESGSLLFGPSYFSNSQDIAALLQGKVVLNAHFEC